MKLNKIIIATTLCVVGANAYGLAINKCCTRDPLNGDCTCYADSNNSCYQCGAALECVNCDSTNWASAGAGSESRINAVCDTNTGLCSKTTEYRCIAGYYGSGKSCSSCPNGGTSRLGDNSTISRCYLPDGTGFSDSTGSGVIDDDCYY